MYTFMQFIYIFATWSSYIHIELYCCKGVGSRNLLNVKFFKLLFVKMFSLKVAEC